MIKANQIKNKINDMKRGNNMKTVLNLKTIALEVEIKNRNVENELSICAEYNGSGGQCLDSIKRDIDKLNFTDVEKVEVLNIISIWEEYHLKSIPGDIMVNLQNSIDKLQGIIEEYAQKDIDDIKEEIKEYLKDNIEETTSIIGEINSWNGDLEEYTLNINDECFFESYFEGNPYGVVEALHNNDNYNINDDYVGFDMYGDLVSYDEYEYQELLKDNMDEIVEGLIDNLSHVSLSDDLQEIINKMYE